ncbi:MAG: hypothetical protein M3220_07305, partial [Chloroflexota bacterium]|nr:hypothetical protein [Chloroflexota bacterium]
MRVMKAKLLTLWVVVVAVTLLMATFASLAYADGGDQSSPREFLSQFEGRRVPNEMPPRDDDVAARAAGIPVGATESEAQKILDKWYEDFYTRKMKSGPNPIAYAERMADIEAAQAQGVSPKAMGGGEVGTAQMLMIPFEFAGSDQIQVCEYDVDTGEVGDVAGTVEVEGPLHGQIAN